MTSILTGIGLTHNIIGTLLVWRFGLPERISRAGTTYLVTSGKDEREVEKAKGYDRMSRLGVFLLILGFVPKTIALLA